LEGAINAMNAATAEMTRSQWKHLFIGALLEALLSLGLESVPVREVLHYATIYIGPVVAHIRGLIG
jgi:hypothetical protein